MEYIEGKSLSKTIKNKTLNFDNKIKVSLDIIKGLREIHRLDFVHRDLKPDNILITNEQAPRAIICDYGLLKKIEGELRELTEHDDTVGSNTYMSLHQRRNPSKADKGDDIYSLCLCLFEIFTGEKWHTGYAADLDQQQDKLKRLINEVINFDSRLDSLHSKSEEMRLKYGKEQKALIKEQKTLIKNIPKNYSLDDIKKLIDAQKTKTRIKPLIISGLIIAILSVFTIFQIFFHKYALTINTTPPKAQVRIVNPEMEYTPGMKLEPGEYHIEIFREGFKKVSDLSITIKDRDIEQEVKLVKLYRLTIKTIPEAAQVGIVKPEMKYAPGMELEPGKYDIEISHSGFKTESLTITIPDDIMEKNGSDKEEYLLKEVPQLMDKAIDIQKIPKEKFKFKNRYGMNFVYIPPDDSNRIPTGFYMQTTELTQGQWESVVIGTNPSLLTIGTNPSLLTNCGDREKCVISPVNRVSWGDVRNFINALNMQEGVNNRYRLPTEAEWEYACRAGTKTPFSFGNCLSTDKANYDGNYEYEGCPRGESRGVPLPVASLSPNNWGLYDMHGNVMEWCEDIYQGRRRVIRGGSWESGEASCRSDYRRGYPAGTPYYAIGFRLVMTREENTQ